MAKNKLVGFIFNNHCFFRPQSSFQWFPSQGDRGSTLITRLIRLSLTKCALHDEYLAYQLHCYSKVIKAIRTSPSDAPWDSSQLASFHLLWRHFSAKLNAVVPTQQQGKKTKQSTQKVVIVREMITACLQIGLSQCVMHVTGLPI